MWERILFSQKSTSFKELLTLRVFRPVTRLTVHWASLSPLQSQACLKMIYQVAALYGMYFMEWLMGVRKYGHRWYECGKQTLRWRCFIACKVNIFCLWRTLCFVKHILFKLICFSCSGSLSVRNQVDSLLGDVVILRSMLIFWLDAEQRAP